MLRDPHVSRVNVSRLSLVHQHDIVHGNPSPPSQVPCRHERVRRKPALPVLEVARAASGGPTHPRVPVEVEPFEH